VIAVSKELRRAQILRRREKIEVIYNGIDLQAISKKRKIPAHCKNTASILLNHLFFCRPYYKTKGIIHLVNAIKYDDPETQIVLCAGA
jgi:hypothetical protein